MLLVALKKIPGTIQVEPGQSFYEPNDDNRALLLKEGFARPANPVPGVHLIGAAQPVSGDRPLSWPGADVVIIASGPSLTAEQCDDVRLWQMTPAARPRRVIAINTSFQLAPFADVLYACDGTWWDVYADLVVAAGFTRERMWTQDQKAAEKHDLRFIRSSAANGLSRKPGLIHQGQNSTYQAINLAFLAGARKFILLGVDCHGTHWHGDHPPPLKRALPHKHWMARFADLARDLKAEGVKIVNCSPGTALQAFPVGKLDEELQ